MIIDSSANFVNNSQKILTSLHKINKDKYSIINNNLINYFPEYFISYSPELLPKLKYNYLIF